LRSELGVVKDGTVAPRADVLSREVRPGNTVHNKPMNDFM